MLARLPVMLPARRRRDGRNITAFPLVVTLPLRNDLSELCRVLGRFLRRRYYDLRPPRAPGFLLYKIPDLLRLTARDGSSLEQYEILRRYRYPARLIGDTIRRIFV